MIRLSKSSIGKEETNSVSRVLEKEYLGMGEEVNLFESKLRRLFGRHVICVASGTAALQLSIQSCDIGIGDEILVQSLTYVASFQAITANGAKAIPCDVNLSTLTIDLEDAKRKLSTKTKAIMPVHYSGGVGNLDEIYKFANENNLRVIEDAAHAFGTKHNNKLIGSFGDVTCFSFDGIKNITCGEGGCLVTDDSEIIKMVKDSRLLGVVNDSERRYKGERSWDFEVDNQGWRYHMSNIMAAIGIEQLNRFPEFEIKRKRLSQLYDSLLNKIERIILIPHDYNFVTPHIYVIRINNLKSRKILQDTLLKEGIQTGVHYYPNHFLKYFSNNNRVILKNTEKIFPELLTLPLHPDLKEKDIYFIVSKLLKHIDNH
jgi:dTDP-4-amino-4,6-dideoxygalactose transaminase